MRGKDRDYNRRKRERKKQMSTLELIFFRRRRKKGDGKATKRSNSLSQPGSPLSGKKGASSSADRGIGKKTERNLIMAVEKGGKGD